MLLATVAAPGCGEVSASVDHSTPQGVVQSIFDAAQSGDLEALEGIADPEDADGDAKNVAGVATLNEQRQEEFQKFFATGRIVGDPEVEGNEAAVDIRFGPDGEDSETMNLVRRDGKWYLHSF